MLSLGMLVACSDVLNEVTLLKKNLGKMLYSSLLSESDVMMSMATFFTSLFLILSSTLPEIVTLNLFCTSHSCNFTVHTEKLLNLKL